MGIADYCKKLDDHLTKIDTVEARIQAAAEILSMAFKVTQEEVAIFLLDADKDLIHFHWPLKLKTMGFVPLSSLDSLAAKTARENKSFLNNRFASVHHASIFEKVRLEKGDAKPLPIQKIMSVPIPGTERMKGVVQVSRKGLNEEAVKDFQKADVDNLSEIARTLSSHF
ncbi:GAF domain-containing protein [Malonomonas rubra]|uniref:GAF domain-containing protein n=1 Tax=Malonomonas rubra TaxID=57040 RepID=UPI0026F1E3D0|nr:GAF domain-containing protein [Malonomonas rubra]